MPTKLRTVNLDSGSIRSLMISLADDDKTLLYELAVNKPTEAGSVTLHTFAITEREAELMLKIASHR